MDQKQKTLGVYSHRCKSEKKKGECSSSLVIGCRNCTPLALAAIRKCPLCQEEEDRDKEHTGLERGSRLLQRLGPYPTGPLHTFYPTHGGGIKASWRRRQGAWGVGRGSKAPLLDSHREDLRVVDVEEGGAVHLELSYLFDVHDLRLGGMIKVKNKGLDRL